jgi:hypothetical protein
MRWLLELAALAIFPWSMSLLFYDVRVDNWIIFWWYQQFGYWGFQRWKWWQHYWGEKFLAIIVFFSQLCTLIVYLI